MTKRNSRFRINMFFIFLVFSALLWLLVKLSEQHRNRVVFNLDYEHVPEDKLLTGTPPEHLYATIEASGYRLLQYYFKGKNISLGLRGVQKRANRYFLSGVQYRNDIVKQLPKNAKIIDIVPDTLYFEFDKRIKKEVPVVCRLEYTFLENFRINGSLQITPETILINGPEQQVNKVKVLYTEEKSLKEVNEDIHTTLNILYPEGIDSIELSSDEVTVTASVERFSEKVIKVPVSVSNLPADFEIKTFPSEVSVVCKAPVDELKDLKATDFEVNCDYGEIADEGRSVLVPRLAKKPRHLNDVRIVEEKVEFILRRL